MLLVFIDETSDSKFKDYFGLCVATINSFHYKIVKEDFQNVLRKSNWDETIEFKGSCLFSATRGDTKVGIPERIDIAHSILDLNIAKQNARMRFHYLQHKANPKTHSEEYLGLLPKLLEKAIPTAEKGGGKDVISVSCDYRSDIDRAKVHEIVEPVASKKGFTLFEEVTMPSSNFNTVGILYADIVGYLAARIDTISNDVELFENIPPEQLLNHGKVKKLKSSVELIAKIKKLDKYKVA